MRIKAVRTYPLYPKDAYGGAAGKGENNYTLIEIEADNGPTGYGSTDTTPALTAAAMRFIEPLLIAEMDIAPARISEALHQHHFWLGPGNSKGRQSV